MKNYGVTNPTLNKSILEKSMRTLTTNNLQKVSKQQKYFYDIFGGELNYNEYIYSLDIADLENKIDIEYNGGGHNLNVKLGEISETQFIQKETFRKKNLYKRGWRILTIISERNKTMPKELSIQLKNSAINYMNKENRHWVEIYIDSSKILTSQFETSFEDFINKYNGERLNEETT